MQLIGPDPRRFDHFIAIDWSGAAGRRHKGIAIAIAHADGGPPVLARMPGGWSRNEVLNLLLSELPDNSLVGLDLGISLPFADCGAFFPGWDKSPANAKGLWALIDRICDSDDHLAATSFVQHQAASEYFHHGHRMGEHYRCDGAPHRNGRLRRTEVAQRAVGCKPHSNFKLVGTGQVGKSSLTGMRVLNRLAGRVPVWPIDDDPGDGSLIVEIYTAIAALAAGRRVNASKIHCYEDLNAALAHPAIGSPAANGAGAIADHASDALLTAAWLRAVANSDELWHPDGLEEVRHTEGWTFGVT